MWLGRSGRSVSDTNARQLREDVPFRQEWARWFGLQNVGAINFVKAA
jgi:hypothetical protein